MRTGTKSPWIASVGRLALLLLFAGCSSPRATDRAVSVLLFVTTDCPVANAFAPEINRIVSDYGPRGVAFTRVYTDVTLTPEAVVLGRDGERVYRGRIDDRYVAPGQYRVVPTTHELRDAIEAALDGRPAAVSETRAVGCPIDLD